MSPIRHRQRGAAVLLSLVTIMMMLALAVPFVVTTGHHRAGSMAHKARTKARLGAESGANQAMSYLTRNTPIRQFPRRIELLETSEQDEFAPNTIRDYMVEKDPYLDIKREHYLDLPGQMSINFDHILPPDSNLTGEERKNYFDIESPRQQTWAANITDEQGKVDLNTAGPALLGNILGSAIVLKANVESGGMGTIEVVPGGEVHFPIEDGYFVINGVLCQYSKRKGSVFRNVRVGVTGMHPLDSPQRSDEEPEIPLFITDTNLAARLVSQTGALLLPVAAHLIPYYRMMAGDGARNGRFATVDQMRSITELDVLRSGDDGILPRVWKRARTMFSVHTFGYRDGGFFYPHIAQNIVSDRSSDSSDTEAKVLARVQLKTDEVLNPNWLPQQDFRRQGPRGIPSGATLRFYDPGEKRHRLGYHLAAGRVSSIEILPRVEERADRPIVEFLEVTPINVNTASKEVLIACFKGLGSPRSLNINDPNASLTGEIELRVLTDLEASIIADAILYVRDPENAFPRYPELDTDLQEGRLFTGGLRSIQDLTLILNRLVELGDQQGLAPWMRTAVVNAQLNPYASNTRVCAPFTYASRGVYSIDAMASTFSPTGFDTARHRIRQVVEIGTDEPQADESLFWEWKEFGQFEAEMSRAQGNVFSLVPTDRLNFRRFGKAHLPWLLDPNAKWAQGTATQRIGAGVQLPFQLGGTNPRDENYMRSTLQYRSGINNLNGSLRAGYISFWFRAPENFMQGREKYIFDVAESGTSNRVSLLWWNDQSSGSLQRELPALVLRVADRSLQSAYTAAVLEVKDGHFEPGKWYHIRASWKGHDLSHLSLLVDGVADLGKGEAKTHQIMESEERNNAWVKQSSRLQSQIDPQNTQRYVPIDPDDVSSFDEWGVVKVGDEAIEYEGKDSSGLRIRYVTDSNGNVVPVGRNARDTYAYDRFHNADPRTTQGTYREHPIGSRVEMWGYSSEVISHYQAQSKVPLGSANLASPLTGPGVFFCSNGPGTPNPGYAQPELVGPDAGLFQGAKTIRLKTLNSQHLPQYGMFLVYGPCWTSYVTQTSVPNGDLTLLVPEGSTLRDDGSVTLGGNIDGEFMSFRKISSTEVEIIGTRYDLEYKVKAPENYYYFFGAASVNSAGGDLVRAPGTWDLSGSVCVLSSIHLDRAGEYLDPQQFSQAQFPPPPGGITGPLLTAWYDARRLARVQIGNVAAPTATRAEWEDQFQWFTYDRVINLGAATILSYTKAAGLTSIAQRATSNYQLVETGNLARFDVFQGYGGSTDSQPPMRVRRSVPITMPQPDRNYWEHQVGAPVTPVFLVTGRSCGPGDRITLLASPNGDKSEGRIGKIEYQGYNQNTSAGLQYRTRRWTDTWVALDRHINRAVNIREVSPGIWNTSAQTEDPQAEIVKFPSTTLTIYDKVPARGRTLLEYYAPGVSRGALNECVPITWQFGDRHPNAGGSRNTGGEVDEVVFEGYDVWQTRLVRRLAASSTDEILIHLTGFDQGNQIPEQGIIKIDDEYIYYRSRVDANVQTWRPQYNGATNGWRFESSSDRVFRLRNLTRGLLGSSPEFHGPRSSVFLMRRLPAFQLSISGSTSGSQGANSSEFQLIGDRNLELQPFGFLRIEEGGNVEESQVELAGYTSAQGNNGNYRVLLGDFAPTNAGPLFRGAYGTRPKEWETGNDSAILTQFWVRQPDYTPRWMRGDAAAVSMSPEVAHIEGSESFHNARLESLVWSIDSLSEEARLGLDARLVFRFNGGPSWDSEAGDDGPIYSHIWQWKDDTELFGNTSHPINKISLRDIAPKTVNSIEWRVYFTFKDSAYDQGHWKETLEFHGLKLNLTNDTKVLSHEELR